MKTKNKTNLYKFKFDGWDPIIIEAPSRAVAAKKAKQLKPKTLYLSLFKEAFDVMVTGEKTDEFRKGTQWLRSRLFDKQGNKKHFDFVKFTNGYVKTAPYFICKFIDFEECTGPVSSIKYSNGLHVWGITTGDFIIKLGKIIKKGNLKK